MAISRRKKALREQKLKLQSLELRREKMLATKTSKQEFKTYVPQRSYVRDVESYPSFQGQSKATTGLKERQQYSGDYITGLATMHKSNIVPVGRGDDPKNYATMRRN